MEWCYNGVMRLYARFTVRLPIELRNQLDIALMKKHTFMSRNNFIIEAIQEKLNKK